METKLNLITERAKKERECKFNNLAHLLNLENLKECYYLLKKDRALGIDGVSMDEYGKNLEGNLTDLIERMKRQAYKPQPVRRVFIPKSNGKTRPLGIPSIEDKIVQKGIARILEAIFEVDFFDFSYGFRPNRNCHHALDRLDKIIMSNPVNHIIDADIRGFFDNVNQDWLIRCLKERISDKNLIRIIVRFLKSGVMVDGILHKTEKGTPQGGLISPILANIYLHFVLDLWFEKIIKKTSNGYVEIVRYADDFVICVQFKEESERILEELKRRLKKFELELAEDKIKIVSYGKYADKNARKQGKKAGIFNFLGFTHYCDKTRKGYFKVGRKTDRKKFNAKMKDMNIWLKQIRNMIPLREIWSILRAKLKGHFQYYGVSGNFKGISRFYCETIKLVFKWLNRRSQKKSFNWERFNKYVEKYKLPKPKIHHNFYTLFSY